MPRKGPKRGREQSLHKRYCRKECLFYVAVAETSAAAAGSDRSEGGRAGSRLAAAAAALLLLLVCGGRLSVVYCIETHAVTQLTATSTHSNSRTAATTLSHRVPARYFHTSPDCCGIERKSIARSLRWLYPSRAPHSLRHTMSQPLIRTRAEYDAADLVLQQSTAPGLDGAPTTAAPAIPSASTAMDSMWSEYEQYLQAARTAQEAGIDIHPQPAFVVKVSLVSERGRGQAGGARKDLLEDGERVDSESDKLFINVCTDACVDAPEIVKPSEVPPPSESISSAPSTPPAAAAPPGSLRLPMSVGPVTPCSSRSGSPSLFVDVVIHPSTLAQPLDDTHSQAAYQYAVAQAALIQRQSGTAPPVLTPGQQQAAAMRELKRTVAAFALQRIEEKYKLRVDEHTELRFPKAVYKGTQPPPAHRIRRNRNNPLHAMTPQQREQADRRGKLLVQEVTQPAQSRHSLLASSGSARAETVQAALTQQSIENCSSSAKLTGSQDTQQSAKHEAVTEKANSAEESAIAMEQPTTAKAAVIAEETTVVTAAVTPAYTVDVDDSQLTLQVQIPGVVSTCRRSTVESGCCESSCSLR